MPRSQAQGQRSGEGTAGLWKLLSEDDKLKNREPADRTNAQREHQEGGAQRQEQECAS
jgi:hypothetical protein